MIRRVMILSYVAAAVFLALAYMPDPGLLGADSEPARILFYGMSGLLAGVSVVVAVISTMIVAVGKWRGIRKP